jgi:hypothetical protein
VGLGPKSIPGIAPIVPSAEDSKQYSIRLKRSGMFWTVRGANPVTAVGLVDSGMSIPEHLKPSFLGRVQQVASRFSKIVATGRRVPRKTHAPLTFPGTLSTAAHFVQSSAMRASLIPF